MSSIEQLIKERNIDAIRQICFHEDLIISEKTMDKLAMNDPEILKLLLIAGFRCSTLILSLTENYECVKLLLEYGYYCPIDCVDNAITANDIMLTSLYFDHKEPCSDGAVEMAIQNKNPDLVNLVLQHNPTINTKQIIKTILNLDFKSLYYTLNYYFFPSNLKQDAYPEL